jgi:uncharacterized protein (TIGR01319 family)
MPETGVLSIDIGSTYTKGGLFSLEEDGLRLRRQVAVPTTPDDLTRGFAAVRRGLEPEAARYGNPRVYFSSSARGGLKIAALGLTPDLTLSIAKMAACSAGGRIVRAFSYRLSDEEVAELEALAPDIILFTGGTDGGSEKTNLHNAARLAASSLASVILYAGNRKIRPDIQALLSAKELVSTDNVMPEVGDVNIEPARDVIRRIFLDRIVDGKGLAAIVREVGTAPKPTPLAVYDLVGAIPGACPGWEDFGVIDMGGATTDFYSNTESFHGGDAVLLKGVREPRLKRTVEGDLGLRVSVEALCHSERACLVESLRADGLDEAAFTAYVRSIAASVEAMPQSPLEERFDALLAGACVRAAARRHAGSMSKVFSPQGSFYVQKGKDLTRIKRLVGSGGYLSRVRDSRILSQACLAAADIDERPLLPGRPDLYADTNYLFPLLGNLVSAFPETAARAAVRQLTKLEPSR